MRSSRIRTAWASFSRARSPLGTNCLSARTLALLSSDTCGGVGPTTLPPPLTSVAWFAGFWTSRTLITAYGPKTTGPLDRQTPRVWAACDLNHSYSSADFCPLPSPPGGLSRLSGCFDEDHQGRGEEGRPGHPHRPYVFEICRRWPSARIGFQNNKKNGLCYVWASSGSRALSREGFWLVKVSRFLIGLCCFLDRSSLHVV